MTRVKTLLAPPTPAASRLRYRLLVTSALAVLLAGCGPDASDEAPPTPVETTAADPANPFAAAEATMKERMASAIGGDVSDTWLKQMIEHHRGAIEMARIMLQDEPSDHVRQMAQETVDKQGAEVDRLTAMLGAAPADPASDAPFRAPRAAMEQAMMAAKGADPEETFLRKMLEHHRGAVALSDALIAAGGRAAVIDAARKTRTEQAREAAMIGDMLAGKPMAAAATPTAGGPASPPTPRATAAASRAAPKAVPGPSPAPTATPTPTPEAPAADPHAGHTMSHDN